MNRRNFILALALLVLLGVMAGQVRVLLADPTIWPPDDYVEYYAAAVLHLEGKNPYSPELLLPLQVSAGRDTDEAIMMWNPPWTLPFVLPLGVMPARVGQLMWLLIGGLALAWSVHLLRRTYPAQVTWHAWLLAGVFVPAYMVLQAGQIGPLMLLGAAGFVYFAKREQFALAGMCAVLLAVKPHLAYLLWAAMLADAIVRQRYSMLGTGVAVGLVCAALPLVWNPDVYTQYFSAMRDHPPAQWVSLTLGTLLRVIFGSGHFGLQFVPVLLGLAWFAYHWWPRRHTWDWVRETPMLLLVSFITSPYGAWHFDLVLLVICILQRAANADAKRLAIPYFAMNAVMLGINLSGATSIWFAWVAPMIFVLVTLPNFRFATAQKLEAVPA
jgi:hypothetical protein